MGGLELHLGLNLVGSDLYVGLILDGIGVAFRVTVLAGSELNLGLGLVLAGSELFSDPDWDLLEALYIFSKDALHMDRENKGEERRNREEKRGDRRGDSPGDLVKNIPK